MAFGVRALFMILLRLSKFDEELTITLSDVRCRFLDLAIILIAKTTIGCHRLNEIADRML